MKDMSKKILKSFIFNKPKRKVSNVIFFKACPSYGRPIFVLQQLLIIIRIGKLYFHTKISHPFLLFPH